MSSFNLDQPQKGTYPPILPELALSRERMFNHYLFTIFGVKKDIDEDIELIAPQGGERPVFPSSAQVLFLSSTSADDTSSGLGANSVKITGLDSNYAPISEIVTLDGVNPVSTTNSYLRVNVMKVEEAGTEAKNSGDISAVSSIPFGVVSQIAESTGQSSSSVFTVPDGMDGYVYNYIWSVGKKQAAKVNLVLVLSEYRDTGNVDRRINLIISNTQGTSSGEANFRVPPVFGPRTDSWIEAEADDNNIDVSIAATMVLVDNEDRQFELSDLT